MNYFFEYWVGLLMCFHAQTHLWTDITTCQSWLEHSFIFIETLGTRGEVGVEETLEIGLCRELVGSHWGYM